MNIKPINQCLTQTGWKPGQKVKVLSSSCLEEVYVVGKVFTLVDDGGDVCFPGSWNGYSAELLLLEEKGQLSFRF